MITWIPTLVSLVQGGSWSRQGCSQPGMLQTAAIDASNGEACDEETMKADEEKNRGENDQRSEEEDRERYSIAYNFLPVASERYNGLPVWLEMVYVLHSQLGDPPGLNELNLLHIANAFPQVPWHVKGGWWTGNYAAFTGAVIGLPNWQVANSVIF